MSAQEIIERIKELPPAGRAQVARFIVENDDSWIPDEFKQAMKDAEEGRLARENPERLRPEDGCGGGFGGGSRLISICESRE